MLQAEFESTDTETPVLTVPGREKVGLVMAIRKYMSRSPYEKATLDPSMMIIRFFRTFGTGI